MYIMDKLKLIRSGGKWAKTPKEKVVLSVEEKIVRKKKSVSLGQEIESFYKNKGK